MILAGCIRAINQWNAEKNNVSLTSAVRLGSLAQAKYKVESLTKKITEVPAKYFNFLLIEGNYPLIAYLNEVLGGLTKQCLLIAAAH